MAFPSFVLALILGAALAANAAAASRQETAKDWTASLDEVDTGEDVRKTCTASTSAGDAQGVKLTVAISNGDVLPPDAYPQIVIAAGGLASGMSQPAVFAFDDKTIEAKFTAAGNEVMIDNVKETSLAVLKALAAGDKLTVTLAGKPAGSFSLAGFTASYRKLGEWCGFPTADVTK